MTRDLGATIVDTGARAFASASPELRSLALRGPQRPLVLAQIFRAMGRQFDAKQANGVEAVVQWEIARASGGADRWQVVIANGRCRASRRSNRQPTITIAVDGPTFLELVTGMQGGPSLFMSGKLKVTGDLMFAARLPTMFRVPRPRAARS